MQRPVVKFVNYLLKKKKCFLCTNIMLALTVVNP